METEVQQSGASFYMPAEWEPHAATWLAWPHEESDWPGKFESIAWVYGEIVRHLSRYEQVCILTGDPEHTERARSILLRCHVNMSAVQFFPIATDRSWTRDYCPTFARDCGTRRLSILDWRFNGWAKYDNSQRDDAVPAQIAEAIQVRATQPKFREERVVLEGGSIDVNGAGSLLTTEECLLSDIQSRNPGLGRSDYESIFHQYLGITNTVWLRNGIAGDDTHGHVDDLARFTSSNTIVIAVEQDRSEVNFEPLQENLSLLQQRKDQDSSLFQVETLPMPAPVFFDGQRLPASYANFYIANGIVLMPTFNDANDRIALDKLTKLFPDREVIGIASTDLVLGLGTLHCMTQQQPA